MPQFQQDGICRCYCAGAAWLLVEHRQFAEKFPGAQAAQRKRLRHAPGKMDAHLAAFDDIHRIAGIALHENRFAGLERATLQFVRERQQIVAIKVLERRNRT